VLIFEPRMTQIATPSSQSPEATSGPEDRFVLHGVPWHLYVSMRDGLDHGSSRLKLTYLHGDLELISPSSEHEERKSLLGRLLEAWCADQGIELYLHGSTTIRNERVARGIEADESYSVGRHGDIPDLAIEVVHSAWRVDKLETYRGLGVPEVWVYRDRRIDAHVLVEGDYQARSTSALFPALRLDLLAAHSEPGTSLTAAIRDFRAALADG
jgi:Uma2 family endonuclease